MGTTHKTTEAGRRIARKAAHEAAVAVLDAAIKRQQRRAIEAYETFKRTGDDAAYARVVGHERARNQFKAVRARTVQRWGAYQRREAGDE